MSPPRQWIRGRLIPWLLLAISPAVILAQTCNLKISLRDDTRVPVPGLIRIRDSGGKSLVITNLQNRGVMLRRGSPAKDWHCLVSPATIRVPQGRLTIEAVSGLESRLVSERVDLTKTRNATLDLEIKRFTNLRSRGWRSGNTHVHTRNMTRAESDRYLQDVGRADGLEVVFVSHLRRALAEKTYISNDYTKRDLRDLSLSGLVFENGEEHRHNFGGGGEGFGHVMLLDLNKLIRPVSVGPGIMKTGTDAPPLARGIAEARRAGATVVWCHNSFGFEDIPNWLTGRVDAQNIFDGGNRGGYQDTFYRYLNIGLRVPFSTGTDWFIYDYSRVYARAGSDDLTASKWLDALKSGRTFISNGPLLDLKIDNFTIGDEIILDAATKLPVRAQAMGRGDFGQIELLRNGSVIASAQSQEADGYFHASLEYESLVDSGSWFALRVSNPIQQTAAGVPARGSGKGKNELGEPLFAHTSPIYVRVAGRPRFDASTARELVTEMEAGLLAIQMTGVFANARERAEVESVYESAIERLNRNIAAAEKTR